jgi:hypothetical protein
MTGPIQCSRTVGSPTLMARTRARNRSTKAAYAGFSTKTREAAEHFWPCSPKA